jgi:hypothetical protein
MAMHVLSSARRLGILGGLDVRNVLSFVQMIHSEMKFHPGATRSPEFTVSCCAGDALSAALVAGRWQEVHDRLAREGLRLVAAGAEAIVFADLALAPVAREVCSEVQLALIGPEAGVADTVRRQRFRKVVVVGAQSEVEQRHWSGVLEGVEVVTPTRTEASWLRERGDADYFAAEVGEPAFADGMLAAWERAGVQAALVVQPVLGHLFRIAESPLPVLHAREIQVWSAAAWLTGRTRREIVSS